jgi:hypothetical protein
VGLVEDYGGGLGKNAGVGRVGGLALEKLIEKQQQILRLTTPKLKSAWGPVRSG